MDESKQDESSFLFLVRLWPWVSPNGDKASWQGKVQHIATGNAGSFADWPSLVNLLTSLATTPSRLLNAGTAGRGEEQPVGLDDLDLLRNETNSEDRAR